MRSLVFYIVVFLPLASCGIKGNQLSFLSLNLEANDYKNFIQFIRRSLTQNTYQLYGIPILKNSVPPSQRFITFALTNAIDETITLAIDKVNLGVVGYLSNNTSYMFLDAPIEAFRVVFPSTCRVILDFYSDYQSIETKASTTRQEILLGYDPMLSLPSLALVSLQDNWVRLSSQIQASPSLQGLFGEVIELYDSNDEIIQVDAIDYPIIINNIVMLLYHCNVDVEKALPNDGNPIILFPCGQNAYQKWTFQIDGTIQSLGKCLTFNDTNFVIIYNCSKVAPNTIKWEVSMDGTIRNLNSGLVLTANSPARHTELKMEANTQTSGQCWRVGNYIKPIVGSIVGFYGVCLEALNNNTNIVLENCEKSKKEQYWAFCGDGTIRVNRSHNLSVSSSSLDCLPGGVVTVLECSGGSNQRWDFNADGSIMNPKCGMAMDVDTRWNDIILYPKMGEATQQWNLLS
ncbi:unnamed protein product [Citrullus colocynthis]|uniref:Ribosome-inactivating protein n=1 Tax=Citrullus colocynthis TaxID=252529 RepID=A0ABP0XQX2_9ROSI